MRRLALRRPRIRTVLFAVNMVILLLPLLGIGTLRLYENELVHQTESALIAQGSYIREHFRVALVDAGAKPGAEVPASLAGEHRQAEETTLPPLFGTNGTGLPVIGISGVLDEAATD